MKKKGPFLVKELKALSPGTQIWGKYLVLNKVQRKTRDGREIIDLKLGDSSGTIDSIVWDNCSVTGDIINGSIVGLLGDIMVYNNRLQVTAKRIKILEEDISPYLKTPPAGMDSLVKKFDQVIEQVIDPYLSKLLQKIFTEETRERFFRAPAAKMIHHNYYGGLLEHTLSVAALCSKAADEYQEINRDILLAGALLHDIGKIAEYEMQTSPQYTVKGRLIGHIVIGSELISNAIDNMRKEGINFPDELDWMLRHMILSHHGRLEFGSPVIPLFPEAFVLYMMDNLDAKMYVFKDKLEDNEGSEELFTNYDQFFEQIFFKYRYQPTND